MRTRLDQLERLAADLANVSTAGYKRERIATSAAARPPFAAALDSAVDVVSGRSRVDLRPGRIGMTGRDLDVAIDGRGFFVIETTAGPRYTRNGSFTRRADGVLVSAEGDPVAGRDGPITLGPGPVTIAEDGTVKSGGRVVGQLRLVDFEREGDVIRESGSRFRAVAGVEPADIDGRFVGGALEQSNVSIVDCMAALTEISRGFEALQRGISVLMNDIDMRAIAELTRR